ncbi:MAG: 2-dehydropantoate 2-reductase [Burkholderiaceae bacterium]
MARIAVIGTGAMGSIYAALMADAGHDVWAVDTWEAHVDAIRRHGLRVEGASGDRLVKTLHATTVTEPVGVCDLVIIATKASGVGSAAAAARTLIGPDTTVMTIQNGLGAGERIRAHLPGVPVILGVAQGFGASMRAPGHAYHHGMSLIRVGEMDGGISARIERVVSLWQGAGFETKAFADIKQLIWEKFICNCAYSGPCTVFGRTIGEMLAQDDTRAVCVEAAREAYVAGRAMGVAISFDDPAAYVLAFGGRIPDSRPSMLQDHDARRPSEIDAINGMVPVVAAEVGTAAPYNTLLATIIRAREQEFGHASGHA